MLIGVSFTRGMVEIFRVSDELIQEVSSGRKKLKGREQVSSFANRQRGIRKYFIFWFGCPILRLILNPPEFLPDARPFQLSRFVG
jgi:hypothetical protein